MSNSRQCEACGAIGDPPPCKDWKKCRVEEEDSDRVEALEARVEHLETLVRGLVGEDKFNVGLP